MPCGVNIVVVGSDVMFVVMPVDRLWCVVMVVVCGDGCGGAHGVWCTRPASVPTVCQTTSPYTDTTPS